LRTLRIAATLAAMLLAGPAWAEPFPNWDINHTSMEDSTKILGFDEDIIADPPTWAKTPEDQVVEDCVISRAEAAVAAGPETMFNRYVAYHTKARNYLAAHWSSYSDFKRLDCLRMEYILPAISPSYPALLGCLLGGYSEVAKTIGDSPDPGCR
jgi:hypothetical protein